MSLIDLARHVKAMEQRLQKVEKWIADENKARKEFLERPAVKQFFKDVLDEKLKEKEVS